MNAVVYRWDGSRLTPTEANQKILEFAHTYGPRSLLLIAHLAVVEQLRVDITSLVRINFMPREDRHNVALDADVLYGSLTYELGAGYFKMDRQVRRYLINMLNAWHVERTGTVEENRANQVAHFVRTYVHRKRKLPATGKEEHEYLNRIDWVALAYHQPDKAAKSLAEGMVDASISNNISADFLKFSRIRPLIELPIAPYVNVLNYARMIEAISLEDFENARRIASHMSDDEIDVCGVHLPAPNSVVKRYELLGAHRMSYRAAASQEAVVNETHVEPDFASPVSTLNQLTTHKPTSLNQPETPLHRAVKGHDIQRIEQLLTNDRSLVDELGPDAKSALHLAVERDFEDVAELLCNNTATIDIEDGENNTPLIYAAENGCVSIAKLLLRKGATLSHLNIRGEGFLHESTRNGHLSLAGLFLEQQGDVNLYAGKAAPPLAIALKAGRYKTVDLLIRNGAHTDFVNSEGTGALAYACIGGSPKIIELLLEFGCNAGAANRRQYTPIMFAAFSGKTDAFNYLLKLEERYDQTTDSGQSPMHLAAEAGHLDLLKHILGLYPSFEEAIDKPLLSNAFQWTPIRLAALRGYSHVVKYLVDRGDDVNTVHKGWNLLHICCQGSSLKDHSVEPDFAELIQYLLKQDLHINCKVNGGWTALHISAGHNAYDIVGILGAQPGIDLNAKDDSGNTALLYAASDGKSAGVAALTQLAHVDFDAQSDDGKQALVLAVEARSLATVSALLASSRIDRNHRHDDKVTSLPVWRAAKTQQWDIFCELCSDSLVSIVDNDENGASLLHELIEKCPLKAVDALLDRGFSIDTSNGKKETPLILAIRLGKHELVQHLLDAGAYSHRYPAAAKTSPLEEAVRAGSVIFLRMLCDAGADIQERNAGGKSLLHQAAGMKGRGDIVEYLIENDLSLDSRDNKQRSPLHDATECGDRTIMEILTRNGGNWDAQDENGLTALLLAIRLRDSDLAIRLIKMGADVSLTTVDGWTALHFAALYDLVDTMNLLIRKAPSFLNLAADTPSITPLQAAAEIGAAKACRLLAEYEDTEIDYSTGDRLPAVFLAAKNGHTEIVSYLLAIGASRVTSSDSGTIDLDQIQEKRKSDEQLLATRPSKAAAKASRPAKETRPATVRGEQRVIPASEASKSFLEKGRADEWSLRPLQNIQFSSPDDEVPIPWHVVTAENRSRFLEELDPIDGKHRVASESTQVLITFPPFYKDVQLLRVRDSHWRNPRLCIFYLRNSVTQNVYRLNGTSPPIHEVNAKSPINLSPDNVLSYVRFFGFFVRGEEGPFYILEDGRDTALGGVETLDETTKSVIEGTARPAHFVGLNKDGHFEVDAVISYSNALFIANYAVHKTGMVEMLDDEPIAADLPIRIDAPIA